MPSISVRSASLDAALTVVVSAISHERRLGGACEPPARALNLERTGVRLDSSSAASRADQPAPVAYRAGTMLRPVLAL